MRINLTFSPFFLNIIQTIDEAVYDDNDDDTNILTPKENNNDEENGADNCAGVELRETADCNGTYSSCDISESDSRSEL